MPEPLQLDQDDYAALFGADAFFAHVRVLEQRKGVTESDIDVALSTLNERAGKLGACVVVLEPELQPDRAETPAARYFVRIAIQVIVQPLLADDPTTGVGLAVEEVCERVRQLGHARSFGRRNVFMFDGMEPIAVGGGRNSYLVFFRRLGGDSVVAKLAAPAIATDSAAAPAEITLTVPSGATGFYTLDGTLPTALNGTLYTAPFTVPAACTLRAAAVQEGYQQSDPAQLTLT
jgi:hypothetical protein